MRKGVFQRLVLFVTLALLIVAFSGCGAAPDEPSPSDSDQADTQDPSTLEPVQIDVFSLPANESGLYDQTWWGQLITEKTGAVVNLLPSGGDQGSQKLQGMIAAGELPDVVIFQDPNDIVNAARANLLVNLDDHLDMLPNAVSNISGAMQYYRDSYSNDTGKLFALPNNVGPQDEGDAPDYAGYIRWDLYKQIGMPAVNTMEDYLPILKQMQEVEPATADGKKVYGFSLFKDWDGLSMANAMTFCNIYGIDVGDGLGGFPFLQGDYTTFEAMNILDPESEYMRTVHFYYEANQMGLVDPDSLTQTFDSAKAKCTEGRVLFSWWNWFCDGFNTAENQNAENPVGFMSVMPKDAKACLAPQYSLGDPWAFAIGANTKKLDTCLRYVDFMYSTDGLQELINGPKGVTWDIDTDGKPYIKDDAWTYVEDPSAELPGGGTLSDGTAIINSIGLSGAFINPATDAPINYTLWDLSKEHMQSNPTALLQDWQATYGYDTVNDYLKDNDMVSYYTIDYQFAPLIPNDIDSIATSIGDIVTTYSWQMVFAEDDAQYQGLYDEMMEKANGLGLDTVYDWSVDAWEQARDTAEIYLSN